MSPITCSLMFSDSPNNQLLAQCQNNCQRRQKSMSPSRSLPCPVVFPAPQIPKHSGSCSPVGLTRSGKSPKTASTSTSFTTRTPMPRARPTAVTADSSTVSTNSIPSFSESPRAKRCGSTRSSDLSSKWSGKPWSAPVMPRRRCAAAEPVCSSGLPPTSTSTYCWPNRWTSSSRISLPVARSTRLPAGSRSRSASRALR